jgi:hypothetical protein
MSLVGMYMETTMLRLSVLLPLSTSAVTSATTN